MEGKSDFPLDNRLSYRQVLWCIPVILLIHNAEEMLTMPQWMEEHLPLIREKIFLFRFIDFSETQLYISLFLVSLIPFILAAACLRRSLEKRTVFPLLVLQGIIFWNALMPHLGGIIYLQMYNPGVVTAAMINIPFSVYLFHRSVKEEMFTAKNLRDLLLIASVAYLPVVYLNHLLAEVAANVL